MKRKEQEHKNRILKYVVLTCVLLVAGISVFAGRYLRLSEKNEDKQSEENRNVQEDVLTKEAVGVKSEEKMFGQSFSDVSDGKKVIRIVEVIPHEICSVFPYLVDWKDVKSYNENTALGYDGLRYFAMKSNMEFSKSHPFSLTKDGITRDYLDDYNVTFIQEDDWDKKVGIWRQTKMDSEDDILGANGYFEYVGNNKGLYNINLDELVKESDNTKLGIRYDIMAMKRKGTQSKKGEWEVKDPQYYWAKDYAQTTTYPTAEVKTHTGFNYDLEFETDASGEYRIQTISVNLSNTVSSTVGNYEYAAELASGTDWTGGYIYSEQGNYKVSSTTTCIVNDLTVLEGKYIRIDNTDKDDGSGLPSGYFRRYTSEDNVVNGDTVYDVVFSSVSAGEKGNYILNPAAVQSEINLNKTDALTKILFKYVGENKGNYDLSFIYSTESTGGALYSCDLLEVSNGEGRYALTSKEDNEDNMYEQVGFSNGDYSKVVTSIDCAGIDYTRYAVNEYFSVEVEGYYRIEDNKMLPGLTMGWNGYGSSNDRNEHGDWVFHSIDSDQENGITKIEELKNGVPSNKRIYVYGQNRKNRFYAQNGFQNNEWFKLLLYLSTEDGSLPLAYQDYADGVLTPTEIKAKYKKDIEAFDRAYRVEIIQKTPGELTKDDVEKADLVYFGNTVGLPGLNESMWNTLVNDYHMDLPYCSNGVLGTYTSDLSTEALMALYDNCLYEKTTALIFSAECIDDYTGEGRGVTTNLGKLGILANLFNDPTKFAYFIEGYPEKNEDYSTIHTSNAYITTYEQNISGIGILYNLGTKVIDGDGNTTQTGDEISPNYSNEWNKDYFRVVEITPAENGDFTLNSEYENGSGKYGYIWSSHSWWNFTGKDVTEADRTWYIPELTANIFDGFLNTKNVWKILHNKKSKETSEPVIVVTNADGSNISELQSVTPIYYYYVDAYALGGSNVDFDIDFRVNWRPEEIDDPTDLRSITITKENGSIAFSQENPIYKTDYTCNVATDFIKDGAFDPSITSKEYTITATDAANKSDTVIVRFIVRDSFMLN